MSVVYMTSDWHFGHTGVERFRTEFGNVNEMEGLLLENYLSTVNKRDIVWMLGDMAFDSDSLNLIKQLPGIKNLVMGNHDTDKIRSKDDLSAQMFLTYDNIHSLVSYKGFWLSHAPIHPIELRGKNNIHGHVHSYSLEDERYINVCPEVSDYKLVKFQDIKGGTWPN